MSRLEHVRVAPDFCQSFSALGKPAAHRRIVRIDTTVVMPRRALPTSLMLGAPVGTAVLGVGGRLAMRAFAMFEGRSLGFSLGGCFVGDRRFLRDARSASAAAS